MKSYQFVVALALAAVADAAWAVGQPMGASAAGNPGSGALSSLQAGASAARRLAVINEVLRVRLLISCNKCKSGFALKVLEQAMQKQPALAGERYAQVERLRTQGEAFYNEGKFKESLELLQQAEAILGIDASGDRIPPSNQTSGAGEEPVLNR